MCTLKTHHLGLELHIAHILTLIACRYPWFVIKCQFFIKKNICNPVLLINIHALGYLSRTPWTKYSLVVHTNLKAPTRTPRMHQLSLKLLATLALTLMVYWYPWFIIKSKILILNKIYALWCFPLIYVHHYAKNMDESD